jgi:hypothetical protein
MVQPVGPSGVNDQAVPSRGSAPGVRATICAGAATRPPRVDGAVGDRHLHPHLRARRRRQLDGRLKRAVADPERDAQPEILAGAGDIEHTITVHVPERNILRPAMRVERVRRPRRTGVRGLEGHRDLRALLPRSDRVEVTVSVQVGERVPIGTLEPGVDGVADPRSGGIERGARRQAGGRAHRARRAPHQGRWERPHRARAPR